LLQSLGLARSTLRYNYLRQGESTEEAKDFDDLRNYNEMMEAFSLMGFTGEESEGLLKVVAAVLHLGNVTFDSVDQGEASVVSDSPSAAEAIQFASALLGVPPASLADVLVARTITTFTGARKETTSVRLTPQKAVDTRDSLAKTLFDKVFLEIIVRINFYSKSGPSSKCIGLLDIFGFEIFKHNSFEQLCINYCNEMLQNHFNLVIFINEKKIYAAENIVCDTIEFKDNALVISSVENCFKTLDEEAKIPKGSSKTWFDKMKRAAVTGGPAVPGAAASVVISYPTSQKDSFVITHYAGPVSYSPESFMEKNIDTLNSDILQLMGESTVADIRELFRDKTAAAAPDDEAESVASRRTSNFGKSTAGSKPVVRSISWNFQNQLSSLMRMLGATESHFIRCIKSNDACRSLVFDSDLVHRQLVYSGVFEVVKIQQSGLPFRFKHRDFFDRYSALLPESVRWTMIENPSGALDIIKSLPECERRLTHMQVGRTMTFMNSKEFRLLESLKDEIESQASTLLQYWLKTRCLYRHYALYR
jgi:myosin-5